MKIVHCVLFIALLTSSFDLFLLIDLSGANLRLSQVMLILVVIAACAQIVQSRKILWPRGGTAITLWCVIQAILLSQSVAPIPSAELYLLLMFSIVGIFAVLQLYGRSRWIGALMKTYVVSFVCIACFGIFQFVAPALHLGQPFITQWIVHGKLPRVSGFSYEPSFYATYMIMGWITLVDLRVAKAGIVSGRRWYWLTWLVSVALFISTSKTVWALMIAEGLARLVPPTMRLIRRQVRRLHAGDIRVPLPRSRTVLWTAAAIVFAGTFIAVVGSYLDLNIFLQGSGLNNTAAHSVTKRTEDFVYTTQIIQEHPWVGRSLGGVAARIGELRGEPVRSAADLKLEWGFPVPVDVLAASGILGVGPFLWFFLEISIGERKLIRSNAHDERAKWLRALIRALLFEWLILSADQNLVRMYLWFHVAVLVAVGYNLRYNIESRQPPQGLVTA